MEEYNVFANFHWLNPESFVHYVVGYLFAHMFWIKDEKWAKIQPIIGVLIVIAAAVASYGK